MLDVGWTELVVIAIVLIIVVGPKDLPPMLRTFGRMMSKMRGMAADFRHQFDEALREADLDDVRKTLNDAQRLNPANSLREAMNPLRQMGNDIKADLQKATRPDEKPAAPSSDLPPSSGLPSSSGLPPAPEIAASAVLPEQPVAAPPAGTASPVAPVLAVPLADAAPVAAAAASGPAPRKRQVKTKPAEAGETAAPRRRAVKTADDAVPQAPRKRKPAGLADDAAVAEIGKQIATAKPKRRAAGAVSPTPDTPKSGDDA